MAPARNPYWHSFEPIQRKIVITRLAEPSILGLKCLTWGKPVLKKPHPLVKLGAILRGGTPHFDYVAAELSKGIAAESLRSGRPIIFGVLTCDTLEQALEMADLMAKLG